MHVFWTVGGIRPTRIWSSDLANHWANLKCFYIFYASFSLPYCKAEQQHLFTIQMWFQKIFAGFLWMSQKWLWCCLFTNICRLFLDLFSFLLSNFFFCSPTCESERVWCFSMPCVASAMWRLKNKELRGDGTVSFFPILLFYSSCWGLCLCCVVHFLDVLYPSSYSSARLSNML